jgi:hypothetical protein
MTTPSQSTTAFINRSITAMLLAPLVSLAVGIFTVEFSKPFLKGLGLVAQQQALAPLSLGHGHVVMIFGIVPLIVAVAAYWLRDELERAPSRLKWLTIWQFAYFGFGFVSLALLIYKGAALLPLLASFGDLDAANHALFAGSHALRVSLYALAHPIMALALGGMVVTLLRVMNSRQVVPSAKLAR